MLDLWIIEDLKRREREERDDRPRAELPLWPPGDDHEHEVREEDRGERGVVVIDYRL